MTLIDEVKSSISSFKLSVTNCAWNGETSWIFAFHSVSVNVNSSVMWYQLLCYCNAHDIPPAQKKKKKKGPIKIVDSSVYMQYHSLIIEKENEALHFIDVKRYMLNIEWINQTL